MKPLGHQNQFQKPRKVQYQNSFYSAHDKLWRFHRRVIRHVLAFFDQKVQGRSKFEVPVKKEGLNLMVYI